MTDIHFGTDGWRARIAEDYTFDNVRRCAQGVADYLAAHGKGGADVVLGYDKRFAAEHFAAAAAEVMVGNGFRVWLTDAATPTPVISYSVVERKAACAINITASHNPPWDCGFKVRDERAAAVAPDGLREIETLIPPIEEVKRTPFGEAKESGRLSSGTRHRPTWRTSESWWTSRPSRKPDSTFWSSPCGATARAGSRASSRAAGRA
jgi:phosphomannomutase